MSLEFNISCEACGKDLEINREYGDHTGYNITVAPCDDCLDDVAEEFLEMSEDELLRRKNEHYHYK